jgi:hypothetical protein
MASKTPDAAAPTGAAQPTAAQPGGILYTSAQDARAAADEAWLASQQTRERLIARSPREWYAPDAASLDEDYEYIRAGRLGDPGTSDAERELRGMGYQRCPVGTLPAEAHLRIYDEGRGSYWRIPVRYGRQYGELAEINSDRLERIRQGLYTQARDQVLSALRTEMSRLGLSSDDLTLGGPQHRSRATMARD